MVMAFFLFFDALPSEESALRLGAITKGKKLEKTIKHERERDGVNNQNGVCTETERRERRRLPRPATTTKRILPPRARN